jgi:Fe-S-cluster containining protein
MFKCRDNCGECCGIVGFSREFLERNKDKFQRPIEEFVGWKNGELIPVTKDIRCPFLKPDKTCAVYEERPDVCREFGISPRLVCAYFRADGKARTPAKTRQLKRRLAHGIDNDMKRIELRAKLVGDR